MARVRVLVSSCLLGERVRYHGGDARYAHAILERWRDEERIVAYCPEMAAGLGAPRPPAEIRGGDGSAVLDGRAEVVTKGGEVVTDAFLRGATGALETVLLGGVGLAVLTDASPSCAPLAIYDGSFSRSRRSGRGVTAALLERNGIRVFAPADLDAAQRYLETLERTPGPIAG